MFGSGVSTETFFSMGSSGDTGGAVLVVPPSTESVKPTLMGRPKYWEASSWNRSANVFLVQSNLNRLGAPIVSESSLSIKDNKVRG